ncbi:MAG: hypothetical protein ACJ754_18455 [Pyrinomonadaceae bacterium]
MIPLLLSAVLLAAAIAVSPLSQTIRIGGIEFFGDAGVDLGKVRAALPLREGDDIEMEKWEHEKERVRQSVRQATGVVPIDVAATCCDARGGVIIYTGLSGKHVRYLPSPKGSTRLPADVIYLYDQTDSLLQEALLKGISGADISKGYPLSAYPPLRAVQLRIRDYAVGHEH